MYLIPTFKGHLYSRERDIFLGPETQIQPPFRAHLSTEN